MNLFGGLFSFLLCSLSLKLLPADFRNRLCDFFCWILHYLGATFLSWVLIRQTSKNSRQKCILRVREKISGKNIVLKKFIKLYFFGFSANYFGHRAKRFREGYQNCILRVQKTRTETFLVK